ncbi:hypothetical protein L1887_62131 [Cichorium endivia]|nr:hypothetical protein L1887_62131 [Cichorium endivia]
MTTDEIPTLPTIEVRWSVPNEDVVSWLADLHEDSRVGYVDGWHQDRDYHEITVRYHVDKPLGEFIDQIKQIPCRELTHDGSSRHTRSQPIKRGHGALIAAEDGPCLGHCLFELGDLALDARLDLLGRTHNVAARLHVSRLAELHHGRPGTCNERARTRSRERRGGIHSAGPVGLNVVLEPAQLCAAVQDGGKPLGPKAVLVRVARDRGDAIQTEVERLRVKAGLVEEGHEEGAEAAIYVQQNVVTLGEFGEVGDVVDDTVGEVGCGTDEADGVAVDGARDTADVDLARDGVDGDVVHLDAKVGAGLVKGSVRRDADDEFGLGDALGCPGPLAHGETREEDGLGAARGVVLLAELGQLAVDLEMLWTGYDLCLDLCDGRVEFALDLAACGGGLEEERECACRDEAVELKEAFGDAVDLEVAEKAGGVAVDDQGEERIFGIVKGGEHAQSGEDEAFFVQRRAVGLAGGGCRCEGCGDVLDLGCRSLSCWRSGRHCECREDGRDPPSGGCGLVMRV